MAPIRDGARRRYSRPFARPASRFASAEARRDPSTCCPSSMLQLVAHHEVAVQIAGWLTPSRKRSTAKAAIQPVLGGAVAPIGTPDSVLTRARRSRRRHQVRQVPWQIVADRRGISGGEVMTCFHTVITGRCEASHPKSRDHLGSTSSARPGMTRGAATSPTPRWRLPPRAGAWPTALPRTGCCLLRSRQSRIAATPRADRAARISPPLPAAA